MEPRVTIFFIIAVVGGVTQSATVEDQAVKPSFDQMIKPSYNQTEKSFSLLKPAWVNGKTFFMEVWFKSNWFGAIQYCKYHGFNLAIIRDSIENDALFQALKPTAFNDEDFWTSANDLDQKDEYIWYSNGQNVTYSNFGKGEPNHWVIQGEMEHCIEGRSIKDKGFIWNDVRCSVERYIICEKQA